MVRMGQGMDRQARRDWWRWQIQRQRSGNVTVTEFCRQLGVNVNQFYYWRQRVDEACAPARPRPQVARHARRPAAHGAGSATFVPVSIQAAVAGASLEVELPNACVVRLRGDVEARLLRTAIRAAGELAGWPEGGGR